MPSSSLCDYSDAHILVNRTITLRSTGAPAAPGNRKKKVILKNFAPFTGWIREIKIYKNRSC